MAKQEDREPRPMRALFFALVMVALVRQLPQTQCGAGAAIDAYTPSVTVRACGVGVTLSL